ncbi:MAG: hypothetical protein MJA82_07345 [Clostridia bacterium]|nr:hypothetical protein [Clostridia bacterium]
MRRFRKNQLIVVALICFISSLLIFYYNHVKIPRIKKEVEAAVRKEVDLDVMEKRYIAVVKGEEIIPKYTALTDEILEKTIELREIPLKFALNNGVEDIELIRGKITQEALRPGEQITYDSVSTQKKWFGDYDRLTEYDFNFIVAGEVKEGNIIDVLVNYDNGDYDVIIPKIKVRKLIENKTSERNGSVGNYTLVVALNEEQQRDAELALKLGYLEARLYIDESQRASPKTFNYDYGKEKLNLGRVTEKVVPQVEVSKDKVEEKNAAQTNSQENITLEH